MQLDKMKTLEQCRIEIDEIDQQIVALFEKRMAVAKDVVTYKMAHDLEIFQPEREKSLLQKNINRIQNPILQPFGQQFFQDVMDVSKAYQSTFLDVETFLHPTQPVKNITMVGFQGVEGSFSSQARNAYFGEVESKNYKNFEDVYVALKNNEIDYGIVPLENSSTGAIHDNYDLLRIYGFSIVGEVTITIQQNLLGLKGATIDNLKQVYSHPQGLFQSSKFLKQYPSIEQIEYSNTAAAAKLIHDKGDRTIGAIASIQASKMYDLEVLQENIQNASNNETRFIVVGKNVESNKDANRVSIIVTLHHKPGALYSILKTIQSYHINLSRIESRPIVDKEWQYYFYIDFEGNIEDQNVQRALQVLKGYCLTLDVIGNYQVR